MTYESEFIPTRFARNDEMKVEAAAGNCVVVGFYGQDGKTSAHHGMSTEAASLLIVALQEALRAMGGVVLDDEHEPGDVPGRLEYLRGELRAERISWGDLAELQSLAPFIPEGDVELLEAAGVPEHAEDRAEQAERRRMSEANMATGRPGWGAEAVLREIILRTLGRAADDAGVVRERPLYLTDEIMRAIELSDGGEEA